MKTIHIIVALVLFLTFFAGCQDKDEPKDISKPEKISDSERMEIEFKTQFISRFSHLNPIIFPPKDFENKKVFTYTLQQLLINDEKRPVIFDGYLDDISKIGDQFFIHFTGIIGEPFFDEIAIRFHLKCSYEDVKEIIDHPPTHDPFISDSSARFWEKDFIVICRVSKIRKNAAYFIEGHPAGPEEIELNIRKLDVFSASGELIEMMRYPSSRKTD